MTTMVDIKAPLRILIYALGGEGGGVLMNWTVAAARSAGYQVQATSVPGVAQRTGSTTYYIEIAEPGVNAVFNLVPMPGRVDVLVASELVEAGRAMESGYVSPALTTLIASTSRTFTTAEKIAMGDGHYGSDRILAAAKGLAKRTDLRDFSAMAETEGTYVSAVLFGALAGSGALPWPIKASRSVVEGKASLSGFDRASKAEKVPDAKPEAEAPETEAFFTALSASGLTLPDAIHSVAALGHARCVDFQDADYGRLYLERLATLTQCEAPLALTEAARRLALWMAYEDVARVADLKTRPERFARIRAEADVAPGQLLHITEYLKPRIEEIADILPERWGRRLMVRAEAGKSLPFLGKGRYIRSSGPVGYRMLRGVAWLGRFRRGSLRYGVEQAEIDDWLAALRDVLPRSKAFGEALAELPRVRKGYSDTAQRGLRAYRVIMSDVVRPAVERGQEEEMVSRLRDVIAAAMADDTHTTLGKLLELGGEDGRKTSKK